MLLAADLLSVMLQPLWRAYRLYRWCKPQKLCINIFAHWAAMFSCFFFICGTCSWSIYWWFQELLCSVSHEISAKLDVVMQWLIVSEKCFVSVG